MSALAYRRINSDDPKIAAQLHELYSQAAGLSVSRTDFVAECLSIIRRLEDQAYRDGMNAGTKAGGW